MTGEQIGLGGVRIARQDERLDPHVPVHVAAWRAPDRDRRRSPRRSPSARGRRRSTDSPRHSRRPRHSRAARPAPRRRPMPNRATWRGSPRPRPRRASTAAGRRRRAPPPRCRGRRRARGSRTAACGRDAAARAVMSAMIVGDGLLLVGPHQEHVAALRRRLARVGREPAEIERRALPRDGADPRRIDLQLPELAVVIERLAVRAASCRICIASTVRA